MVKEFNATYILPNNILSPNIIEEDRKQTVLLQHTIKYYNKTDIVYRNPCISISTYGDSDLSSWKTYNIYDSKDALEYFNEDFHNLIKRYLSADVNTIIECINIPDLLIDQELCLNNVEHDSISLINVFDSIRWKKSCGEIYEELEHYFSRKELDIIIRSMERQVYLYIKEKNRLMSNALKNRRIMSFSPNCVTIDRDGLQINANLNTHKIIERNNTIELNYITSYFGREMYLYRVFEYAYRYFLHIASYYIHDTNL